MKAVLSVRDFAILYEIACMEIDKMETNVSYIPYCTSKKLSDEEYIEMITKSKEDLKNNLRYQDLCRIREKLGELHIEVETPKVEVE